MDVKYSYVVPWMCMSSDAVSPEFGFKREAVVLDGDERISSIREQCSYCGGNSESDARGNCCACGAPRSERRR